MKPGRKVKEKTERGQQKGTYREKRDQEGKQKGCRWKRIDEDQLDQKEELDTGPFDS